MKRVLKWSAILFAFAGVFITSAYFLAKRFEEPVRNYIIGEVNKRLDAPVHVSDINFSLLERFPSASLVMDSVWAEENIVKIGEPDTLFFFRKVYLNLNILDLLDGQYRINEIETRDGFMHLLVDEQGYDNFHIWKQSEDTTGFLLELDKVHIENGELHYLNLARQQDILLTAHDLYFAGKFSQDSYTMDVKGKGRVQRFAIKGTSYLTEREVAVESELDITTESQLYHFEKGHLVIDDKLDFRVAGSFEGDGIDLQISGNELDIIESIALIPSESRNALEGYRSSGVLTMDCTLKGAFGNTENPRLTMNFSVENGSITKSGANWNLTKLNGKGSLDNGNLRRMTSTTLVFEELSGLLNGEAFQTHFSVLNLEQPTLDGSLKLTADIATIDDLFQLEEIAEGSGKLELNAYVKTTLRNPSEPEARDFLNAQASGTIHITDADIRLKDDERTYHVDLAALTITDNALEIDAYRGSINQRQLELSGRAANFLDFLFTPDGKLDVNGKVSMDHLDLNTLFPNSQSDGSGSVIVAFPKRANWNLKVITDRFSYGKFEATEVSGVLIMNAFKAEARQLQFQSQQGTVSGQAGIYRFSDNQFGLRTRFEARQLDVTSLFETFNEFGQDFITSRHLQGTADAEVEFQAFCDSLLSIDARSAVASVDLTIVKGRLHDFEPLISVADEIRKKPSLRMFIAHDELRKRLADVQFDELSNEITIRNGVVSIPQMEIRSSAINMNVSGTHSFDNEIDYAMDFAMSELLTLKDRKEPYNEYVERDDEGRTRIYLTMKGTTDDFDVDLERTNLRSTLKDRMLDERDQVKNVLKQEFKGLRKDSVDTAPEEQEMQIEFDPDGLPAPTDTAPPAEKKEDKNILNKIIKKTESNKKILKDGDFEDDDF